MPRRCLERPMIMRLWKFQNELGILRKWHAAFPYKFQCGPVLAFGCWLIANPNFMRFFHCLLSCFRGAEKSPHSLHQVLYTSHVSALLSNACFLIGRTHTAPSPSRSSNQLGSWQQHSYSFQEVCQLHLQIYTPGRLSLVELTCY